VKYLHLGMCLGLSLTVGVEISAEDRAELARSTRSWCGRDATRPEGSPVWLISTVDRRGSRRRTGGYGSHPRRQLRHPKTSAVQARPPATRGSRCTSPLPRAEHGRNRLRRLTGQAIRRGTAKAFALQAKARISRSRPRRTCSARCATLRFRYAPTRLGLPSTCTVFALSPAGDVASPPVTHRSSSCGVDGRLVSVRSPALRV
jgi:hypothetical protein